MLQKEVISPQYQIVIISPIIEAKEATLRYLRLEGNIFMTLLW